MLSNSDERAEYQESVDMYLQLQVLLNHPLWSQTIEKTLSKKRDEAMLRLNNPSDRGEAERELNCIGYFNNTLKQLKEDHDYAYDQLTQT